MDFKAIFFSDSRVIWYNPGGRVFPSGIASTTPPEPSWEGIESVVFRIGIEFVTYSHLAITGVLSAAFFHWNQQ